MSISVGIVQSAYLPWKGYFDIINRSDKFVFFDSVQFSKRSWVTRNRIKSPLGTRWISVPVSGTTTKSIDEIKISETNWLDSHIATLRQSYSSTEHYSSIESIIIEASSKFEGTISSFNQEFISLVCKYLSIETELINVRDIEHNGQRTELLISICKELGATKYISGPAAKSYIKGEFQESGIDLEWMDYSNYPEYEQLHGEFEHQVSMVDLISMKGDKATDYF